MQYRHLYYFVKIVEAGSFSQAARTIHVAQPALSQQIGELEASLGVALLHRSARGIKPTAAGQRFYDEASSILRRYENLPALVHSRIGEIEGPVSLGMPASLSTTLVGPFIELCRATHPKITLRFVDGDSEFLREEVEKSRLDLALIFEDEFFPTVQRQPLFRQDHYLVRSKQSAPIASSTIPINELSGSGEQAVLSRRPHRYRSEGCGETSGRDGCALDWGAYRVGRLEHRASNGNVEPV